MPWTEPLQRLEKAYDELRDTVKRLIWWSVGFGLVMTALALTAIILSSIVAFQQIKDDQENIRRNEQTIIALCEEINIHNTDLLILLLEEEVGNIETTRFLNPRDCTPAKLRKRFGVPE